MLHSTTFEACLLVMILLDIIIVSLEMFVDHFITWPKHVSDLFKNEVILGYDWDHLLFFKWEGGVKVEVSANVTGTGSGGGGGHRNLMGESELLLS